MEGKGPVITVNSCIGGIYRGPTQRSVRGDSSWGGDEKEQQEISRRGGGNTTGL